jgi:hypothetical protein
VVVQHEEIMPRDFVLLFASNQVITYAPELRNTAMCYISQLLSENSLVSREIREIRSHVIGSYIAPHNLSINALGFTKPAHVSGALLS